MKGENLTISIFKENDNLTHVRDLRLITSSYYIVTQDDKSNIKNIYFYSTLDNRRNNFYIWKESTLIDKHEISTTLTMQLIHDFRYYLILIV